ncbi:bifunctional tRNA (5-methylaminomethyl-2-thiouridine)(34)-methyltransferase MnmD/FAD-dependent 5-carboxymethylaminomethyl-2-thiouridine(34) oxidoreductase MnmC [uncultured Piscinibacter sp.]|uniref:bifunctional tRNA (5-methylaminomethyl-2-thiouridine)(34)-methyltransferase MnmD/FAD-dependent 5-carboxymethylaminomethyl-2-thiouridine(34) oxidoreductase MnmC n=1 Tax=uncultured Piscinibacter sp. TaxID=1131835 RepID=UPI002632767F|nr:bifunctional tRNA (5-methylaminomethyl-2-thiouridine)(34)-methyltransferase MnmD/FAD-dependent 5-carboxymethylaminomethyl-2-thiouridine(34) oxidoreductase MnmC [uncultured Piscinibacter sp.]
MKTAPIVPARIEPSSEGLPFAANFDDVYHPRAGALEQARHVFLAGNGLPGRWAGRDRFVIAETGFGLGNNFLAAWAAWRSDTQRCRRLDFLSVELHPPTREDLADWPREGELAGLCAELVGQWPPLAHNLHHLSFDAGRVNLYLAFGDAAAWLPEWVAAVDAFFLDGFAPDRNPRMWEARLFKSLSRLAAPQATAATWSAARSVRDGLHRAGFAVQKAPGRGGKREITVARFEPPTTRRSAPPGRPRARDVERHALIVGGGLAGCAAAWALAEQGWRSMVVDRHAGPAGEGSGNPGGLFHGVVTPDDGLHARWHRAAALAFERVAREAVAQGVPGQVQGLLRMADETADLPAMRAMLQRLGLPSDYVDAVDAATASRIAGLGLAQPAWFYPGGGWIAPVALAAWYLRRAADLATWCGNTPVAELRQHGDAWQLLDAEGRVLHRARSVVLANAGDALRLLGAEDWPVEPVRGQVSLAPAQHVALPRVPLAGAGYVLPAVGGAAVFGATSQRGDGDASVRSDDHRVNLGRLARLTSVAATIEADALQGRTGWRWTSADRLPIVGGVPDGARRAVGSADQPRFIPRHEGLFVFTALGSRGIGMSALGARLLAAWVTGSPSPVEASLMDAVDPARFAARARRQALSPGREPAQRA